MRVFSGKRGNPNTKDTELKKVMDESVTPTDSYLKGFTDSRTHNKAKIDNLFS